MSQYGTLQPITTHHYDLNRSWWFCIWMATEKIFQKLLFKTSTKKTKSTHYFCILFINACSIALISAVFCGAKVGLKVVDNKLLMFGDEVPPCGSCGPTNTTTSGNTFSWLLKVRSNWSSNVLRGSTLVGDRHASSDDLTGWVPAVETCDDWDDRSPAVPSGNDNDCCFFLFEGVPLEVRNRRDRRSPPSLSLGGLPDVSGVGSASGSVVVAASLPELSFFQSPLRSTNLQKINYLTCRYKTIEERKSTHRS